MKEQNKTPSLSTYKSKFSNLTQKVWLEGKLAEELEESRRELRQGKGKLLRSLKTLNKSSR